MGQAFGGRDHPRGAAQIPGIGKPAVTPRPEACVIIELSMDFSISLFQLGSVITLIIIIETVSLPLCGYISDRVNRSLTLPTSLLLFGMFFVLIGLSGKRSLGIFVGGLTAIGVIAGFYHTAAISLLLDLFDDRLYCVCCPPSGRVLTG